MRIIFSFNGTTEELKEAIKKAFTAKNNNKLNKVRILIPQSLDSSIIKSVYRKKEK